MPQTEPNFQFKGGQKDKEKIKQIFRLLLSIPAGHGVISGVVKSRRLAKEKIWWLNHPSVSIKLSGGMGSVAGVTDISHNKIELNCYDSDGRNMARHPTKDGDIKMASTLGHELRHVMTRYGYLSLMLYAQTPKEALLAKILHEDDAWFIGDRIASELYAISDDVEVPEKLKGRVRKYYGPQGRTRHLQDALSGEFSWARHERYAAFKRARWLKHSDDAAKRVKFNALVAEWLKDMQIELPIETVMNAPILQADPVQTCAPRPRTWLGRLLMGRKGAAKC